MLIDGSKKWWRVQNARGVTGYVPSNFMKKSKPSFISSLRNTLGRRKGAEARAAAAAALSTAPQQQVSKNGGSAALSGGGGGADVTSSSEHSSYHSDSQLLQLGGSDTAAHASSPAVAKYAYTAQQPDGLTLAKGMYIDVLLV